MTRICNSTLNFVMCNLSGPGIDPQQQTPQAPALTEEALPEALPEAGRNLLAFGLSE